MVLLINNYDSFTWNLVQAIEILGESVIVKDNDQILSNDISKLNPNRILISPGPGTPKDAGVSNLVIQTFWETIPILGVCLGHQCIGQIFGSKIIPS
ncbi:MAG: aminodeoxychorismate/anthranilate synthase component II, partial [Candidatus Marinimicrobia bacterium]|nr:aminodeoxychorismate/anthranilate synthase component II [Candidatus Neomarinimicrobiota bacterium]